MNREWPNIVLIVIDALRAKNLGCYGYEKRTTPNIDRLAKEGIIFNQCFATTTATDPSLTTIFSGKYPVSHGIIQHGEKVEQHEIESLSLIKFLQSILRSQGYVTLAIDWLGRWHKNGFDSYSGALEKKRRIAYELFSKLRMDRFLRRTSRLMDKFGNFRDWHYDNAEIVTDYASKLVERFRSKYFLLFIHFWDTHMPYNPPQEHFEIFQDEEYKSETERIADILNSIKNNQRKSVMQKWLSKANNVKELLAMYDAELHYTDFQIGRLIQKLDELELIEDSIVIITSDHGESLTEHEIYFAHHGLYDVNINVPMIVRYPEKIPGGKRISELVQHVDVVPTILDLLNVEYQSSSFDGTSLIPLIKNETKENRSFVFAEEAYVQRKLALRTKRFKYIIAPSKQSATCRYCGRTHGASEELYDVENDPEERINIVGKNPQTKSKLRQELTDFITELKRKNVRNLRLKRRIKLLKIEGKI